MPINKEKLASIISGRARELCSVNGDKLISESKKRNQEYDPNPDSYNDSEYYDKMFLSESSYSNNDIEYNNEHIQNSKLPNHIKESLAKQKITMTGSDGLSVLDELGVKPKTSIVKETSLKQSTQNNSSIDYTIIKAIVNECLKEYFDKKPLNESASLQTIGLQNGNISLVDNKGNIYKAKLEKIGNKNKQ